MHFCWQKRDMLLFLHVGCAKQCQHFFRCDDTKQQIERMKGTFDGIILCLTDKPPSSTVMMGGIGVVAMMAHFFSRGATS